jgi:hypothetical protein
MDTCSAGYINNSWSKPNVADSLCQNPRHFRLRDAQPALAVSNRVPPTGIDLRAEEFAPATGGGSWPNPGQSRLLLSPT